MSMTIRKSCKTGFLALWILALLVGLASSVQAGNSKPGIVWAWGLDQYGQLGDSGTSNRSQPVQLSSPSGIISLSGGYYHTLALRNDGLVFAWGLNVDGELGNGSSDSIPHAAAQVVPGLNNITAIAAGAYHNLVLQSDGALWAWGWNEKGQLGDGTTTTRLSPVRILPPGSGVIAIAAGFGHSLALKSDGTVLAWGYNAEGQLGDGTTGQREFPAGVPGLAGVKAISAGWFHSLALKDDGTVWTWGMGIYGQLGIGSQADAASPVQVTNLGGITTIAAGDYHSLALKSDGTLWAWGNNNQGQLGDGTAGDGSAPNIRTTPYNVTGFTPGSQVVSMAGGWGHSLAALDDGSAWSWGLNDAGQLGSGPAQAAPQSLSPSVQSPAQTPRTLDGTAEYTWGQSQASGKIQRLAPIYWAVPAAIPTLSKVSLVAAGYYHSLAIIPNPRPAWDVNGDHIVDISDVVQVGIQWGKTGTPGWIPEDVNLDGVIDISDVALIGIHWNETW